jgi:hypothetical protein
MPLRYQRPYLPRIYIPPRAAGARPGASRCGRAPAGSGVDTSSTGNVGGDIVKAIANTIQQNRQNAIANQILNTQMPPRAGAVGPVVNPATGQVTSNITPTTGTSPLTGGVAELQMRQQLAQQNLADQLQAAKIAAQLALTRQRNVAARGGGGGGGAGMGSAARWKAYLGGGNQPGQPQRGGKGGKAAPYQPGSGDVQNDPATDNFNQIRADFDAQHGKGAYDAFNRNLGNLQDDGKGNLTLTDDKGETKFSIPKTDAPFWTSRMNAARIGSGQGYLGDLPAGINPNSGQPSGSQVNPIKVPDNLTLRSLPYDTWIQLPDGTITRKKPLQTGAGQQQAPAAKPQASIDTTNQPALAGGDQNAPQVANAPPQVLPSDQNVPPNAPLPQVAGAGSAGTPGAIPALSPSLANVTSQELPAPVQQLANVSPQGAAQSYLGTLGLGAGAGQLYPPSDLYG